jgi:hypothetical protein
LQNHTYNTISGHVSFCNAEILTNDVDDASRDDGPFAAENVGNITSSQSTEEGTSGEDRDNERSVATADGAKASRSVETLGADRALDLLDEKRGVENTVDVTRIITCSSNKHALPYRL